jgi:hypothetical protein
MHRLTPAEQQALQCVSTFEELADIAIATLRRMGDAHKEIVQICGPMSTGGCGNFHIRPNFVVERVTAHRNPREVRMWRFRNQSRVGTVPPSTSTPPCPACVARR